MLRSAKPALAGLAALTALAAAPAAQAAVTESNIIRPASPYLALNDEEATSEPTVRVAGTSNGDAGDTVDLQCTREGNFGDEARLDVPVQADGSFRANVNLDNIDEETCRLRAVPDTNGPLTPRYRGPVVAVTRVDEERVSGGPNDGTPTDVLYAFKGLKAFWDSRAPSGQGVDDAGLYSGPSFESESSSWDRAAAYPAYTEGMNPPRGSIVVDRRYAFGSDAAAELYPGSQDAPGLPRVTHSFERTSSGDQVAVTRQALVTCAQNTVPADATSCPTFLPTGVRLVRTTVFDDDGRQLDVTDRFISTDGNRHDVTVESVNDWDEGETGWRIAPAFQLERYDQGDSIGGRSRGSFALEVGEADDTPTGSLEEPFGSLAFVDPVGAVRWTDESVAIARSVRAVPAGGSASINHVYSHDNSSEGIRELTNRALASR